MAINAYVGVNGVARKVKKIYVGSGGIAQRVNDIFVGVNGVARSAFKRVKRIVEPLMGPTVNVGASSNRKYAMFFGGLNELSSNKTCYTQLFTAYDRDLVQTNTGDTRLWTTAITRQYSNASIGEYCIFLDPSSRSKFKIYDENLTQKVVDMIPYASQSSIQKPDSTAVSLERFVIITGGSYHTSNRSATVIALDENLTIFGTDDLLYPRGFMSGASINKEVALFAAGLLEDDSKFWGIESYNNRLVRSYFDDLEPRNRVMMDPEAANKANGYTTYIASASTKKYAIFGYAGLMEVYSSAHTKMMFDMPIRMSGFTGFGFEGRAIFAGGTNWDSDTFSTIPLSDDLNYVIYNVLQEVHSDLSITVDDESATLSEAKVLPSITSINGHMLIGGGGVASKRTNSVHGTDTVDAFM